MGQRTTTLLMPKLPCVKNWTLSWLAHYNTILCVATPTLNLRELGEGSGIHGLGDLKLCWMRGLQTSGITQAIWWTGVVFHICDFGFYLTCVVLPSVGLWFHTFKKSLTNMSSWTTPPDDVPTNIRSYHMGSLSKCSTTPILLVHLISRWVLLTYPSTKD